MHDEKTREAKNVPEADNDGFIFDLPPVSDTTDDFIDDPQPAAEIIYPEMPTGQPPQDDKLRGLLSSCGEQYDPSLHLAPPAETRTGRWRKKRKTDREISDEKSNAAYQMEAQHLATLYGELHKIPFGAGGKIKSNDELIPLRDALAAYMAKHGLREVPPEWAVLLTAGSYSSSVIQREENSERWQSVKNKFSGAWQWCRGVIGLRKKEKPKAQVHDHPAKQASAQSSGQSTGQPAPSSEIY